MNIWFIAPAGLQAIKVYLFTYKTITILMHTLQLNEKEAITQVSVITAVTTELDSVDISIAVEIITRPEIVAVAATNLDVCAEDI